MSGVREVDVVVHTHWDREWYLTRTATLARAQTVLAAVVRELDDGGLPSFLFDGQTVAWRDASAAAEPALAAALRRHAASGALQIGPWYTLADEFLVSGESLLRNLELGLADAAAAGARGPHTGYLPDSFGHVAQMPAILAEWGVASAVVWRGADAEGNVFDWVAPSGATVPAIYLSEGYYQHALNLPPAQGHGALAATLDRLAAHTAAGPLLLTHGGDHLAPPHGIAARIASFNEAQAAYRLRFATLAGHLAASLAAQPAAGRQRIAGELRRNTRAFVLPDVLSTRRYLKLAHQRAEDCLLGAVEPLLAVFWPRGRAAPLNALERCWRSLVEQQAHDSICGCSVDAVHAEMEQRFVQLGQALQAMQRDTLEACGAISFWRHAAHAVGSPNVFADDSACTLFNPLPRERDGWWCVSLFLAGDAPPRALQVEDDEGRRLDAELLSCAAEAELVSPLDDFPERISGQRCEVALRAALPGLGLCRLRVAAAASASPREPCAAIANEAWQVELDAEGMLWLRDRRHPGRCAGALALASELDAGDSYSFSPPASATPLPVVARHWRLVEGWRQGAVQQLELAIELVTPASLDAARQGGSEARVVNRGRLRLRLLGDEPWLHATLHWHNAARDQRTRLVLPLAGDVGVTGADSAFAWIERPVVPARPAAQPTRQEMAVAVNPSLGAITAGDWAIAHEAMHEFEVQQLAGQRVLGLTLVRAVGFLSRRDLRTRGVGAGPDLETPGAQCLRDGEYRLAFAAWSPGAAPRAAARDAALAALQALRRPALLLRGHAEPATAAVDIGNPVVQVSATRRLGDGRLELRLWNPSGEAQPLALAPAAWLAVHADGRPVAAGDAALVPPHGLLTLRERSAA